MMACASKNGPQDTITQVVSARPVQQMYAAAAPLAAQNVAQVKSARRMWTIARTYRTPAHLPTATRVTSAFSMLPYQMQRRHACRNFLPYLPAILLVTVHVTTQVSIGARHLRQRCIGASQLEWGATTRSCATAPAFAILGKGSSVEIGRIPVAPALQHHRL